MSRLAEIAAVYDGSNGDATKALYAELEALGPRGVVALNLFRASKNSGRAKVYRGGIRGQGSYRSMAYERKQWAMDNLCRVLDLHAAAMGIVWGWGRDTGAIGYSAVLYVSLPNGQVSFHAPARGAGPDYTGEWDGVRNASAGRICAYCAAVLDEVMA